ncbi:DinB family protein [Kordia sp. YSTF-M3]|uniref:DinB family protein n=1 Tax=Kordia aestuariivivens TaxID=2759037 RepID=A0ABR7Q8P1_9FLAO|nr:DinB family protein [Kordia aestuariivivens]MBC8754920.1 DinB family protein [Kordia aestuariivivens]
MIPFPEPTEYNPYYSQYVQHLKGEDVLDALEKGVTSINDLMTSLTEEKLRSAYAEGKWTIKEVLQHIMDTERIFCNRALRFARNDKTELPGFEQDDYVPFSDANERNSMEMLREYNAIRQATITMFQGFSDDMFARVGVASGSNMSVRAIAHVVTGHERHHVRVIKERYL